LADLRHDLVEVPPWCSWHRNNSGVTLPIGEEPVAAESRSAICAHRDPGGGEPIRKAQ
jgi:hypothetical protein